MAPSGQGFFRKLKSFRRIAMRADKTARNFLRLIVSPPTR